VRLETRVGKIPFLLSIELSSYEFLTDIVQLQGESLTQIKKPFYADTSRAKTSANVQNAQSRFKRNSLETLTKKMLKPCDGWKRTCISLKLIT
jgi:hypothetical protein